MDFRAFYATRIQPNNRLDVNEPRLRVCDTTHFTYFFGSGGVERESFPTHVRRWRYCSSVGTSHPSASLKISIWGGGSRRGCRRFITPTPLSHSFRYRDKKKAVFSEKLIIPVKFRFSAPIEHSHSVPSVLSTARDDRRSKRRSKRFGEKNRLDRRTDALLFESYRLTDRTAKCRVNRCAPKKFSPVDP